MSKSDNAEHSYEEEVSSIEDPEIREALLGIRRRMDDPDTKELYKRHMEAEERVQAAELLEGSGIPKTYLGKDFDNFVISPQNSKALEACRKYADEFVKASGSDLGTTHGLAVFGDVGVGKSHLAVAVVKRLIERGIPAKYADTLCTLEMIRQSYGGQEQNPVRSLVKYPFLVLDDLGSERPTRWVLEQITFILKYRLQEGLPVMITSNATSWRGLLDMLMLEVRGDYEPRADLAVPVARILDRLRGHVGDPLVITGKSWRGRETH